MKTKRNFGFSVILALGLLSLGSTQSWAAPIISVDMDPITPGIQSSLAVSPGTTFTVDVVIGDDGTPISPVLFDTVILELSFNDAGIVLALGPTGPVAGALAGNSALTFSLFGPPGPLIPGTTVLGTGPSAPLPGFASGGGAIGLADPLLFVIAPGPPTPIFSLDFTALTVGTSSLLAAGTPPGSPELALAGLPLFATLASGTVEVRQPVTVPEPSAPALFAIALAGLGFIMRLRRRNL